MSADEFRTQVNAEMKAAIAGGATVDDVESVLRDALRQLDRVRALDGGA